MLINNKNLLYFIYVLIKGRHYLRSMHRITNMKNNQGMSFYIKMVVLFTVISFFSILKNKLQTDKGTTEKIVSVDKFKD